MFNSLFDIYRDSNKARLSFAEFLKKHPNSALIRLFHVIACVHSVWESGDLELRGRMSSGMSSSSKKSCLTTPLHNSRV